MLASKIEPPNFKFVITNCYFQSLELPLYAFGSCQSGHSIILCPEAAKEFGEVKPRVSNETNLVCGAGLYLDR